MTALQLLTHLRRCDVKLWVEDDQLSYDAPDGALTPSLLEQVREQKSALIDLLRDSEPSGQSLPLAPIAREEPSVLSFAQERLWFLYHLFPESPAYNVSIKMRLAGIMDIPALQKSLQALVDRHESLRTCFPTIDDKPVQVIRDDCSVPLVEHNLRDLPEAERETVADKLTEEEILRPFDLTTGPVVRATLLRMAAQDHILLLTLHHIVTDGWSGGILQRDLAAFYNAFVLQQPPALPLLPIQYADYAQWQRQWLSGEVLEGQLRYWRTQLADLAPLELPTDRPRPPVQTHAGAAYRFRVSTALTQGLQALSRQAEVTVATTLLAAFQVVLARYTGQPDIAVGSPIANRTRSELEPLVGFFVNTLVLRTDLSGDPTFREVLARVHDVALGAHDHQDLPFEQLVAELQPERDFSRNPLFQVMFAFQNVPRHAVAFQGLTLRPMGKEITTTRMDLECFVWEGPEGLHVTVVYNTALFDAQTIERMAGHYERLLEGIVAEPACRIAQLPMLSEPEREQLLVGWNDTAQPYPRDKCVHELFEAQVARTPQAVAVEFEGETLTFGELNRRANVLAQHLIGLGVGSEVLVALCVERSVEMVVGVLGILKTGGAYVPLDPEYPRVRLSYMLDDAATPALLTQSFLRSKLKGYSGQILCLDEIDWEQVAGPSANPGEQASPGNLAYVIYTSGSTGKPKGVEVTHGSVLNLVHWHRKSYEVSPSDRATQLAGLGFDASVWEIWPYLTAGASVILVDEEARRDPAKLWPWMGRMGITLSFLPTPLAETALRERMPANLALRVVLTGGDTLHAGVAASLPFSLVNHYGPTENTVVSTSAVVDLSAAHAPPIGRPIDNVRTYVLGGDMRPVPVGVPGELYVGGASLARGYWRRPELTAERFVADPFSEVSGARLYRTGDLVRYRADGNLEFLGRVDQQVKIRGFRVELAEIEETLRQHPAVDDVVVHPMDTERGKELVAYVVTAEGAEKRASALRNWLTDSVPGYMVPSQYLFLDQLPVNANGKIDRGALPVPDDEPPREEGYTAPRSELERAIASIWAEVLGVDSVGIRDNFFELGGHSLLLVRMHQRLSEALGCELSVVDLFKHTTVEAIAELLRGTAEDGSLAQWARARVLPRQQQSDQVIAVVAMTGRFPGAADVDAFWENLRAGVESIRFFDEEELRAAGVPKTLLENPQFVPAQVVFDDMDRFDARFFGYTPREAELIDPQQRLFLECAREALERAGCDPLRYAGLIGVWAGVDPNSYFQKNLCTHPDLLAAAGDYQVLLASDKDYLCTRVSYKLNLKGPSVDVQTACSTSLVAVHEACEALLAHRCDMALAGGVRTGAAADAAGGYVYQPGGIASPDGHCRAFDAQAQGTVGGAGVGVVVLKRLDDALRDGDCIEAVIRGTATNNDGNRKVGYTAPSIEGQAEVIAMAQAAADVEPESISYIEAHGTGTPLGDPIEVAALQRVFGERTERRQFCALGSVKTNLGHLSAAAGVAGLIKTVLALKHQELPPSLHYETPNPEIDFEHSAFYVNATLRPWENETGVPRRAGVSSFGIGGTNAHVVVEEAPAPAPVPPALRQAQLLVLSAKTAGALEQATSNLAAHLRAHPELDLADVAYTLQTGRSEFGHRRAVRAADTEAALAALEDERSPQRWSSRAVAGTHEVAFLFPGQGAQYVDMGRELYASEAVFRETVERCCEVLEGELDGSLREVLYPEAGANEATSARLKMTSWAQPALFVVEYALAAQWRSWGIEPSVCLGHSIGEYVAACVSGVLELEDALHLVALRGRLMEQMPAGAMTAVPLSADVLGEQLAAAEGLWLAAVNGPSLCVVSGLSERLAAWEAARLAEGVRCQRLHTSHAFHSGLMEAMVPELVAAVGRVEISEPQIPYLSNVTGTWVTAAQLQDPAYWGRQVREAVRFSDGLAEVLSEERRVLLEVGPGQVLGTLARQQPDWSPARVAVPSLKRPEESGADVSFLLEALGRLWVNGVGVDWERVHSGERRRRVILPTYPFERERYWVERQEVAFKGRRGPAQKRAAVEDWFWLPMWQPTPPLAVDRQATSGAWMILGAETSLGAPVSTALRAAGVDVVTVSARGGSEAPEFADGAFDHFVFHRRPEEVASLVCRLAEAGRLPEHIVLAWGHESSDGSEISSTGVLALIGLAQGLERSGDQTERDVVCVCDGLHAVTDEEEVRPASAYLDAIARVMGQELPHLRCKTVDPGDRAESSIGALSAELLGDDRSPTVALRAGRRWTRGYMPVPIAGVDEATPPADGKVYLITGGLGRIGLALAERFARLTRVTLVLTTRSPFPERNRKASPDAAIMDSDQATRVQRVRAIEALGATVVVITADTSDVAQVERLVGEIDARCGRLDGVIHAAGVVGGNSFASIAALDAEKCRQQLRPKLLGLEALDRALRGRDLDFRATTSSISTVLGGLGMGAYAGANAAMDAVAAASPDRWCTIALDGWSFDRPKGDGESAERVGAHRFAMSPEEGVEATRRALSTAGVYEHIIVSTGDLEGRLAEWVVSRSEPNEESVEIDQHARPEISTTYAAPQTPAQKEIAELWGQLLGLERVGVDDDFFELGGHSLLAIQLMSRMTERFQIEVPIHTIFQHSTVGALAEEIERIKWVLQGNSEVGTAQPETRFKEGTL